MTEKELLEKRPDLAGEGFVSRRRMILEGYTSIHNLGNFPFMLNTSLGHSREYYPKLAKKIDDVVAEMKFDISKYGTRTYLESDEGKENLFPVYRRVHEKFNIPFFNLSGTLKDL